MIVNETEININNYARAPISFYRKKVQFIKSGSKNYVTLKICQLTAIFMTDIS